MYRTALFVNVACVLRLCQASLSRLHTYTFEPYPANQAQASFESTSAPVVLNPRGGPIVSECDTPLDFNGANASRVALVNTDRGHGCWTTRDERYFHGDYPVTLGVVRTGGESFDAFEIQPPQALASEFAASHQEMYVLLPGEEAGDTEGFVPTGKKVQGLTAAEVWVVLPAERLPPAPTWRVMSGNDLTECDVGSGGDLPEADTFGDIALVTMTGQSDTCWNWDDYTNRDYALERGRVTGSDGLVYDAFRVSPPNQTAKGFVASRINLYIRQNVTQSTTVWALQASGFHPLVTVDVQAGNFSQTSITVDDLGTRLDDLRGPLVLILQPSSAHLSIWPTESVGVEAAWLDGAVDGGFSFTGRRFAVPGQPFLPQRHWAHGLDSSKTVYGDYKHFTPVRDADGREGIVWQDMDSGTVKLTWLSVDLLTSQTVSLTVLSATGLLVGAVGDGRGTVVILLGDSSQPSDMTANTPGELVKFDAAGNELQRVALPELNLWSFFDSGSSMAWLAASDTISLTLAMKWVDFGATNVIFNATTLRKLRTVSAGSHSWANSLKLSEKDGSKDDYYLGMILGDAFPRGIMISEYRASSDDKRGRVIYYPKTVHRTTATNPKGQVLPVYQEISTATETYYQWSKNLRGNLGFVRIPRDLTSREVLSPGDVENGGFFDEDGQWQNLTNRGVSFLTARTDMDESLSRVKTAELNGSILLFWEVWSGELYKRNEFMVVNSAGELEHAETALQFPVQLPFADDIVVINGKAVAYTGDPGNWLVRYEFCYQNCDPPRSPNDASSTTSTARTTPSTGSGSSTTSVDSSTTSIDGSTTSMNSPVSSTTSTGDTREASAALPGCKNLVALAALAAFSSHVSFT
ncbi:nup98 [Symbiodinium sp. CCMP2592]|nr:nup98 [Symbiodinium sp. CCMP2592]